MGILIPASTAVVIKSVPSVRKFCLIASMDTCDFGFMPLKSSRGIRAAVVGANPNPDFQIQYSIQISVKLYLDLDFIYGLYMYLDLDLLVMDLCPPLSSRVCRLGQGGLKI